MTLGPAIIAGSTFDQNGIHGMYLGNGDDINAPFTLTECQTNSNGADGVRIDTQHSADITKLTARENGKSPPVSLGGGSGLFIALGTSVTLRSSVLLGNTIGVFFTQRRSTGGFASTTLDLGTGVADLGENTFATTTKSANNTKGGVCLMNSGLANSQKAVGDFWSVCPPSQDEINGNNKNCYDATYADVVYVPQFGTSGAPVSTTPSCNLGTP